MFRRNFVKHLAGLAASLSLPSLANAANSESISEGLSALNQLSIEEAYKREDIWERIREAYNIPHYLINLNNGAVSPQPKLVQEALNRFSLLSNEAPSLFMTRRLGQGRENVRKGLAKLAGCSPDEIAILRNTTEALNNVFLGLDWEKGDEVVLAKQDYSSVIIAWKQLAQRKGINLKWVDLDLPNESESAMVEDFHQCLHFQNKSSQYYPYD